jgi:DNA-binding NarL/FixJ family response regulator
MRTGETLRVVIADDNDGLRVLLRTVIDLDPRLECVGVAADGPQALAAVADAGPDLLLLDLSMPGLDGLQVLDEVARAHPELKVIVYSGFTGNGIRRAALAAGAVDYLVKGVDPAQIVERLVAAAV